MQEALQQVSVLKDTSATQTSQAAKAAREGRGAGRGSLIKAASASCLLGLPAD